MATSLSVMTSGPPGQGCSLVAQCPRATPGDFFETFRIFRLSSRLFSDLRAGKCLTPWCNPLVAERALWRSLQSFVTGGQQPVGNPTDSCHFFCTPGNPYATPIVPRGEGSFSYQAVSTTGVRHSPAGA